MAKVIKKKVYKDNEFYDNDPLFQLLSKIKTPEEMEQFKNFDKENRARKERNARFKKYY